MTAHACLRELICSYSTHPASTAQMRARRWLFSGAAPVVGLLLFFLSSLCGRADVVLVTAKPPAPGTVLQDELSLQFEKTGTTPSNVHFLDRMEVRPDGSVRLVRRSANDGGIRDALEGVPLLWRAVPQGWTVVMERSTPDEGQTADLKRLVPPFATDVVYPARPVRLGERWDLNADAARTLLSRLTGMAISVETLPADWLSGWMELASLADREGQRCALLRFAVTVRLYKSEIRVGGDAVRSLTTFQDLGLEAKAEWADPDKPARPWASASFHRSVEQPGSPPIAAAATNQNPAPDPRDAEGMFKRGEQFFFGQGVPQDYRKAREWYQKAAEAGSTAAMFILGKLYSDGLGVVRDDAQALAWFRKAADAGDSDGMNGVGFMYWAGRGVAQDYAQARQWYQKAADAGNAGGMYNLGVLYNKGQGVSQDYARALEWYRKAADAGAADAMNSVGFAYWAGQGVSRDYAQARQWYQKAADAGDNEAMRNLGVLYENGKGVPQDYVQARQWYQKAAAAGNVRAMLNLGRMYEKGEGVASDDAQALAWYRKAADAGNDGAKQALARLQTAATNQNPVPDPRDAEGMFKLGEQFFFGQGVPQDYRKAREWYQKAAEAGSAPAMFSLGYMYREGLGVVRDDAQALAWFRKAADAGDSDGMNGVGFMYWAGRGVARDYAQARQWYGKAADAGNAGAMYNLGVLYKKGQGVAQDYAQAFAWYRKAADAGNAHAMAELGDLYENGRGVTQDYAQAFTWYRKAAEAGNDGVMGRLGDLYKNGLGVAQDYAQALDWYRKAADAGHADAMNCIGFAYWTGQGMTRDYDQARQWYQKAADAGNADAMFNLGVLYENGQGVAQDYTQAVAWYQKAAEAGDPAGMNNVGFAYWAGQGVSRDYAQARQWYQKAAAAGNDKAMLNLGVLYENGQGVAQDYTQAFAWYRKAAEAGNSGAMVNLGDLFKNGDGVGRDDDVALTWYQKAAAAGNDKAKQALARLQSGTNDSISAKQDELAKQQKEELELDRQRQRQIEEEDHQAANGTSSVAANQSPTPDLRGGGTASRSSVPVSPSNAAGTADARAAFERRDYAGAIAKFEEAAARGDAEAQDFLGMIYFDGLGVPVNREKAVRWNTLAAQHGKCDAQFRLAFTLQWPGQSNNLHEKVRLFAEAAEGAKRGAEQGDPFAEYTLGELYLFGAGPFAQNFGYAFSFFMKAAQQGVPQAQGQLGYLYENGKGVAKDASQARVWYTKAAEAGLVEAQTNLAIFLENRGEKEKAIFWYEKSALLGSQSSSYFLKKHYGLIVGDCSALENHTPATEVNVPESEFTKGAMALAILSLLLCDHPGHAPAPDPSIGHEGPGGRVRTKGVGKRKVS
jgi:TPR repeat protein